eukprot:764056-Pyramimonas_sp.AAC.1
MVPRPGEGPRRPKTMQSLCLDFFETPDVWVWSFKLPFVWPGARSVATHGSLPYHLVGSCESTPIEA